MGLNESNGTQYFDSLIGVGEESRNKVECLFESPSKEDLLLFGENLHQIEVSLGRLLNRIESLKVSEIKSKEDVLKIVKDVRTGSERLGYVQGMIYGFISGLELKAMSNDEIREHLQVKFGLTSPQSEEELRKYYNHIGMR